MTTINNKNSLIADMLDDIVFENGITKMILGYKEEMYIHNKKEKMLKEIITKREFIEIDNNTSSYSDNEKEFFINYVYENGKDNEFNSDLTISKEDNEENFISRKIISEDKYLTEYHYEIDTLFIHYGDKMKYNIVNYNEEYDEI